jgi:hypothetical protein
MKSHEMKIYILFSGHISCDKGSPIAAFKTKKALREFVREEYPDARGPNRMEKNEMYWEDECWWIKCDDQIDLF